MVGIVQSRIPILLLSAISLTCLGLLLVFYGYEATWRLWNVPIMTPHFADLRTITHAVDAWSMGLDPMLENPGDPWGRTLNYPRLWQLFYYLGLGPEHTAALGTIVILAFFSGACLILADVSRPVLLLAMGALLSPAAMFGMERGNTDLFIFLVVALAIVLNRERPLVSLSAVLLAYTMKLFPVFASALLLSQARQRFMQLLSVTLLLVLCYAALTWSDILQIREGTPRSTQLSYGLNILWMRFMAENLQLGFLVRVGSWLLALAAMVWMLLDKSRPGVGAAHSLHLDAFRAGAAIYVGTFLVGNNWDYRLVFLVFTLPQLWAWSRNAEASVRYLALGVLLAAFISLWHLRILTLVQYLPNGYAFGFYLDELANWVLFLGLARLLVLSLPDWWHEGMLVMAAKIRQGRT